VFSRDRTDEGFSNSAKAQTYTRSLDHWDAGPHPPPAAPRQAARPGGTPRPDATAPIAPPGICVEPADPDQGLGPIMACGHYAAPISKRGLLLVTPKDLAGCGPSTHELNAWANQARGHTAFRDSASILGRRGCRGQQRGDTKTRPERGRPENREHRSG
jgi:hypothetical protein